jgi:hypothetical protein
MGSKEGITEIKASQKQAMGMANQDCINWTNGR